MTEKQEIDERELAVLAKQFREAAGKNRAEAARELKVARQSIIYAEEQPQKSFFKLRKRIIEKYSDYNLVGPVYYLQKRK